MKRLIPLAALLVAVPIVTAGPVDRNHIHEEAAWVVHIDVARLADSRIGKAIIEDPSFDTSSLDEFHAMTGMDLLTDVLSITAYGPEGEDEEGVVVLETTPAIDEMIAGMVAEGGDQYRTLERDGVVIHGWREGEEEYLINVGPGAHSNRRLAVVGGDAGLVAAAAHVIHGKAASVADADEAALNVRPRPGTLVYTEAVSMPWFPEGDHPASAIIQQTERVSVNVGEDAGLTYARVTFTAGAPEDAANISAVVQGLIAMGRLVTSGESELEPIAGLLNGLAVRSRDGDVIVDAEFETDDLLDAMQAIDTSDIVID